MRVRRLALGAVLVAATAATAPAQQPVPSDLVPVAAPRPASSWVLAASGVGLGASGALLGGLIGAGLSSKCTGEDCQLASAAIGVLVGGTLGMSLGVHLGNHRKGSFALDALAGGAALLGVGIVAAEAGGSTAVLLLAPAAQLVTNVMVERAVGRKRAARLPVAVSLLPRSGGGMTVSAVLRF